MIVVTPTQMMMKWWFNGNFSWWVGDGRPFMVSLFRDQTIAIRFWPWHTYNCLVLWNMIGLFSIYMGCHPKPIDFHSIIFQDGHSQHHQPVMVWSQWPFRTYEMLICWKNATMTTMFFFWATKFVQYQNCSGFKETKQEFSWENRPEAAQIGAYLRLIMITLWSQIQHFQGSNIGWRAWEKPGNCPVCYIGSILNFLEWSGWASDLVY